MRSSGDWENWKAPSTSGESTDDVQNVVFTGPLFRLTHYRNVLFYFFHFIAIQWSLSVTTTPCIQHWQERLAHWHSVLTFITDVNVFNIKHHVNDRYEQWPGGVLVQSWFASRTLIGRFSQASVLIHFIQHIQNHQQLLLLYFLTKPVSYFLYIPQ